MLIISLGQNINRASAGRLNNGVAFFWLGRRLQQPCGGTPKSHKFWEPRQVSPLTGIAPCKKEIRVSTQELDSGTPHAILKPHL